jgi:hypothetical protein
MVEFNKPWFPGDYAKQVGLFPVIPTERFSEAYTH